ncbi:MAG: tripartite tricarboxylate transporter TctB family protein [Hyphomicrobiaceae bacterium]
MLDARQRVKKRTTMLRNSELWGGLFWLLIGGFIVWAGRDMGLGRLNEPGPGFAFYWIGILMSALALGVIGQALVSGGPTLAALWAGTRWPKVLAVVALLLLYGLQFEAIGFIPCTLVLLLVLMWFVDPVDWRLALVVAVIATFGVWAAMTKWLKIQLPAGLLDGWLR